MDTSTTGGEQGEASWQIELRGERGVLRGTGTRVPKVGEAISVGLSLSSGEQLSFDARVCAVVPAAGDRVEVCVEFSELSVPERKAFCRWQRLLSRRDGTTRLAASVAPARVIDAPSSWTRSWA